MTKNTKDVIAQIASLNNYYRDPRSSTRTKVETLWQIGDKLFQMGVKKPHQLGWAVQEETRGLIKRPTIFRSYKIRSIWKSRDDILRDVGGIRSLSYLTEILPLIDPAQKVRKQLPHEALEQIYGHARTDSPRKFREYIHNVKQKHSHGRLGKALDKSKHLKEFGSIIKCIRSFMNSLYETINQPDAVSRDFFRASINERELTAFSNMCIALTTKDNIRLYRAIGPEESISGNTEFKTLYNLFYSLINKKGDSERARLRRLVSAEAFAQISDMVSSIKSEDAVTDYRARQKMVIKL